ncbi:MAG: P-type conjugative transfer protein TrbL, partial [Gammaproteobacteria bacterium]|nr:P-type conjugative transfer protein TrbL [Gammaproteobacteria bacterium]
SIKGSQSGAASASGGVIATAGKAGRIGADAAANLARGAMEVAKAKGGGLKTTALDRISETTGGKIAGAIKAQDGNTNDQIMEMPLQNTDPTFNNSSLSQADSQEVDTESEVAAFVGRDNGSMST